MADDPAVLLIGAGKKPGHVDERHQRDVEGVARPHEAPALLRRVDVEHAGQDLGLVPHDADGVAVEAGEAADDVLGPVGEVLVEVAVVDHGSDDALHVVGLVGALGHELGHLRRPPLRIVGGREPRRLVEVVRGQEREQVADLVEAGLLVGTHEAGHARLGGVAHGPAQLLEGDVLTGDRLHHVGAGDEHVRGLPHHEDEVRHGRAVDGAAGAGPEDHADLGDDARRPDVAVEDAAVHGEGHDALLDAGAGAVVEPDERDAHRAGQVHDLVHLLGEDLPKRPAEDGEVLGEHADPAAVDRAPARDHAVGVGTLVEAGTGAGQLVELDEGALVEQVLDPLPGRQLALGVLAFDGPLRAGVEGLLLALGQLLEALVHGVVRHASEATGAGSSDGRRPPPGRGPSTIAERESGQLVQVTWSLGTRPLDVGGSNVQNTVSTVVPTGCSTVMVASVKATSVIFSAQLWFGQSGAPGIGVSGALVLTSKDTLPFLILEAGMPCVPVSVTAAGFWPGGSLSLPFFTAGLTQTAVGLPSAVRVT